MANILVQGRFSKDLVDIRIASILATEKSKSALTIFNVLCLFADETNRTGINRIQIAQQARLGKRTVDDALKALTETGMIAYHAVTGGAGSYYMINPTLFNVIRQVSLNLDEASAQYFKGASSKYTQMCKAYAKLGGIDYRTSEFKERKREMQQSVDTITVYAVPA